MYFRGVARAGQAIPSFVRLAGHPLRWHLLTALTDGDHRVRELTELVGRPQNLVSYHLRQLRGGGLVTARRSSFDARDTYYHLDLDRCAHALITTGAGLHPALSLWQPPLTMPAGGPGRPRVLFVCTGNSARSPIAEALLRERAEGHVEVVSAGSHPKARIHPHAVRVLRERFGVDIADQVPRHLNTVVDHPFDRVITLCDRVREVCPDFGDHPRVVHWSIPDPAATGDTDQDGGYPAFVRIAAQIDTRIGHLLTVLAATARPEVEP
jgi:protein-tyrosine-phosphatase/DNA-binding transcriptional ArsR family regulator